MRSAANTLQVKQFQYQGRVAQNHVASTALDHWLTAMRFDSIVNTGVSEPVVNEQAR
jgi:hypothetical protein